MALVWVALLSVSVLLGHEIQAWRALLLVALVAAVAALVMDTYSDPRRQWREEADGREDWRAVDARTAFFVRLLESHLTGRPAIPACVTTSCGWPRRGDSGDPADPSWSGWRWSRAADEQAGARVLARQDREDVMSMDVRRTTELGAKVLAEVERAVMGKEHGLTWCWPASWPRGTC